MININLVLVPSRHINAKYSSKVPGTCGIQLGIDYWESMHHGIFELPACVVQPLNVQSSAGAFQASSLTSYAFFIATLLSLGATAWIEQPIRFLPSC
jgi:hypothetical protein